MLKRSRETVSSLNRGSIGLMIGALLIAPYALWGCSGDAELVPNGGGGALPTAGVGVDVSNEFNGIAGLMIGTTTNGTSPIVGGTGETRIQPQQVQVVTLVDPESDVRGIGFSGPQPRVAISSNTTAAGAVFMTPGIATTDPTETALRMQEIQNLDAFGPLQTYIAANLGTMTLGEMLATTEGQALLMAAVSEWWNDNNPVETENDVVIVGGDTAGAVKLSIESVTSAGIANLLFTNGGWRHVAVYETTRRGEEAPVTRPLGIVNGKLATALLFGAGGTPGTMNATTDFGPSGATDAEYTIGGIGGSSSVPFPTTASLDMLHMAQLFTVMDYMVFPIMSLLTGYPASYLVGMKSILFGSSSVRSAISELNAAFMSGESIEAMTAFRVLMLASAVTMVEYMHSHGYIRSSVGLLLLQHFLLGSMFWTAANLYVAFNTFGSVPAFARLRVAALGDGEIIIRGRE